MRVLFLSLLTLSVCEGAVMASVFEIEMRMGDMDIENEENEVMVF